MGFQYQHLDPEKQEIRLLELDPAKPGRPIRCRLFHASLLDNPQYDALSYMWGPSRPQYDIFVNEAVRFPVGRNLRKALDNLRYPDSPRVVWTDAICINQSDDNEKGFQVRLMRCIYTQAQTVCAWIDHDLGPVREPFEDLDRLGRSEMAIDDIADPTYWHPVADVFRNPYWKRLWIQQELVLARKVDIYCRREVLDGQGLLEFQRQLNAVNYPLENYERPEHHLRDYIDGTLGQGKSLQKSSAYAPPRAFYGGILQGRISQVQARRHAEKYRGKTDVNAPYRRGTLLNLFLQAKALNMADQRDRLFGIVGIATDIDANNIQVDYRGSAAQAFCQIFELFIEKYGNLGFLCFAPNPVRGRESEPCLPSWIPPGPGIEIGEIMASRTCGACTSSEAAVDSKTCRLSVGGIQIDELDFILDREPIDSKPISQWLPRLEAHCRKIWPDMANSNPLYEQQEVVDLFFPHLLPDRYRTVNRLDLPSNDQKLAVLRRVIDVANSVPDGLASMSDVVWGKSENARRAVSGGDYGHCVAMISQLSKSIFVGTNKGRIGTMHLNTTPAAGDAVWIVFGCPMPLVLRPEPNEQGLYLLIGRIVVPSLLDGVAFTLLRTNGAESKKIEII